MMDKLQSAAAQILARFIGLCLVALVAACASSVTVTTDVLRPAKLANIEKESTIAILPLNGDNYSGYTSALEGLIAGIEIDDKPYFTIVDREASDALEEEWQRAASDLADDSNSIEFGNLKIADTMLGGTIIRKDLQESYNQARQSCSSYSNGKCASYKIYRVQCIKQIAKLELKLRIINVSTSLVKVKGYEAQQDNKYCPDGGGGLDTGGDPLSIIASIASIAMSGTRKDFNKMHEEMFTDILRQVRQDIAPYYQSLNIKLLHKPDDGLKNNEAALQKLEEGIERFKIKQTELGCEAFRQAAGFYGGSHVIYYNLGVCSELNSDFDEALAMYQRAENVSPIDRDISKNIADAKKRVGVLKRDYEKASSQL